jgi:hypothetical protein
MTLNCSIGVMALRVGGLMPRLVKASTAGAAMRRQSWLTKVKLMAPATSNPKTIFTMRERSS